jgi:outer membrane protein assembly factor BamB
VPVPDETPAVDPALLAAPGLKVRWRAATASGGDRRLIRRGDGLAIPSLQTDGLALALLDATSGQELWRTPAPRGVTWSDLSIGETHAVVSGFADERLTASYLRLADGAVVWQRALVGLGEVAVGDDGTGLFAHGDGSCLTRLIDPTTGELLQGAFAGERFHRYPPGGGPHGPDECRRDLRLLGLHAGRPIVEYRDDTSGRMRVGAVDTARGDAGPPRLRWSLELAGRHVGTAQQDDRGAVLWSDDGPLVVVRVDFGSGRVAWRRELARAEGCVEPYRPARVVDGALLIQACGAVERLDPRTGASAWARDVGDAVGALAGETLLDELMVRDREGPIAVQWLAASDGAPQARVTIPAAAHSIALVPGGVLYSERRDGVAGVLGLVAPGGTLAWRRGPLLFGHVAIGPLVATQWVREPNAHALIDPQGGEILGVAQATATVIGPVPGDGRRPALMLARSAKLDEIVAFEVPPAPQG